VEETKFKEGIKNSIELVDVIIAMVVCGDPSPHNALPTLENPTHIFHAMAKNGINMQPCLKDVYKEKINLCQSHAIFKLVGISEDPNSSISKNPSTS
jgi:hypothetical protein